MSSHREAPGTSQDPVIDSTDLYAFVSPDAPNTVTLICNYIPFQSPASGPNFYEFGDDVLYSIHISNSGTAQPDLTFQFQFSTQIADQDTFFYNTGPITSLTSANWNRTQTYTVSMVKAGPSLNPTPEGFAGTVTELASGLMCPPCNIGPLSTPNYASLAAAAVHDLGAGVTVFAGQRAEGLYFDVGSVFDLFDLRPFENLHTQYGLGSGPGPAAGVNALKALNVHSIAIQLPITAVTGSGPTIGVWATASRQRVTMRGTPNVDSGPWVQVSRLGNPLFNQLLVPMAKKDAWNGAAPALDATYLSYVENPYLAQQLPALYPGVFPNLATQNSANTPRTDLVALLLTGLQTGVIPGFTNYTGPTQADMLRLNTSIAPSSSPNILGLLGGDLAGHPNGRRVFDDVSSILMRSIAGATLPLTDSSFTPDAAAGELTDGLTPSSLGQAFLNQFPYLGVPLSGFNTPSS
jgi:Domain of unknown function (DUF4331)